MDYNRQEEHETGQGWEAREREGMGNTGQGRDGERGAGIGSMGQGWGAQDREGMGNTGQGWGARGREREHRTGKEWGTQGMAGMGSLRKGRDGEHEAGRGWGARGRHGEHRAGMRSMGQAWGAHLSSLWHHTCLTHFPAPLFNPNKSTFLLSHTITSVLFCCLPSVHLFQCLLFSNVPFPLVLDLRLLK